MDCSIYISVPRHPHHYTSEGQGRGRGYGRMYSVFFIRHVTGVEVIDYPAFLALSTTGYTRKSGIIILLYFVLTSPHSSITTLLVNFGRSFSFRSTTISYTDFVSLVPSDKRCYVGRNDRYEVGVRDKKHENSLPLDLHGVKFERISRIFDPTF